MVARWQLWVSVIADCGMFCRCESRGRRFEFPTLIIRRRPGDVPLERSPAKRVKPACPAQNRAAGIAFTRCICDKGSVTRSTARPNTAASRASKASTRRGLGKAPKAPATTHRKSRSADAQQRHGDASSVASATAHRAAAACTADRDKSWRRRRAPKH